MSSPNAQYPDQVWDGSTLNPQRVHGRTQSLDPNQDDWDRVVAEVIALQVYVDAGGSGSGEHDALTNLEWSAAGHVIDSNMDFNGFGLTEVGAIDIASVNGVDYSPGVDVDVDIVTVNVTDTPRFWWNEAGDTFEMSKDLILPSKVTIGAKEITSTAEYICTTSYEAMGQGGEAGHLKLVHGTTPLAQAEAGKSIIWAGADDKLYFETDDGVDHEIPLDPTTAIAEYLQASMGADQRNFNTGDDVIFDIVDRVSGSSISLNTTTGVFTLEAGKTYRLSAGIRFEHSVAAQIGFRWYDAAGTTNLSEMIRIVNAVEAGEHSSLPVVQTIFIPSVNTDVTLRCTWDGDGTEDVNAGYAWAIIEVIAGNAVLADAGTEWIAFTPTLYGSTSAPARATAHVEKAYYRVVGKMLEIMYRYTHTDNTGAAPGSGTYGWGLPAGFSVDKTVIDGVDPTMTSIVGSARAFASVANIFGCVHFFEMGGNDVLILATMSYDQTHDHNVILIGNGNFAMNDTTVGYAFTATIPIQ